MNDIKIVNKSIELADSFRDALDSVSREKMWLAFTEAPPYEHARKFVEGLIRDNDIQVYAVIGDTVVGWCDITRRKAIRMRTQAHWVWELLNHTGEGVLAKECW